MTNTDLLDPEGEQKLDPGMQAQKDREEAAAGHHAVDAAGLEKSYGMPSYNKSTGGVDEAEKRAERGPGTVDGAAKTAIPNLTDAATKAASLYSPEAAAALNALQKVKNAVWGTNNRKRGTIVGTTLSVAALVGGFAFFAALPNEITSLMTQEESRFLAPSKNAIDDATQDATEHYADDASGYMNKLDCNTMIKLSKCLYKRAHPSNPTPTEELDETWDKDNFMDQLSTEGITFEKDAAGNVIMKSDQLQNGEINITDAVNNGGEWPGEASQILSDATEKILVPDGAWIHGTAGDEDSFISLIQAEVGEDTPTSIVCADPGNCEQQIQEDDSQLAKDSSDPENFLKAEEEINVDSSTYAAVEDGAMCVLNQTCAPQAKPTPQPGESGETDPTGGSETPYEQQVATDADTATAAEEGENLSTLAEAEDEAASEGTGGFVNTVLEAMFKSLGIDIGEATGKQAVSEFAEKIAGPVGWILGANSVIYFLHSAGYKVRAIDATILGMFVVKEFMTYSVTSDEQKSGNTDLGLLGSMGMGIAGGTSSPAYSYFLDSNNTSQTASTTHSYLDKNNLSFNDFSDGIVKFSDTFNSIPGLNAIGILAGYVSNGVNFYIGPIISLIFLIPFVGSTVNHLISLVAPYIMQFIITYVLHLPAGLIDPTSEKRVSAITVGADRAGMLGGESIGAEKVTPAQYSSIVNQQQNNDLHEFQEQPFFARMFSTDTPYSLVSRLSLEMPSGFSSLMQSTFASLLDNPFGKFMGSFSTILAPGHAFAATPSQDDPAGVAQLAIPNNDPVFTTDPNTYWNEHNCTQQEAKDYPAWHQSFQFDTSTGEWYPSTVNGCLLWQRTATAAGLLDGGNN